MKLRIHKIFIISSVSFSLLIAVMVPLVLRWGAVAHAQADNRRLITVHDRGTESVFLSGEKTIGEALVENGIELDPHDTVEPSRDEELVAPDYKVNIYRARPVFVVDGAVRVKVMTPFQVADHIAKDAGVVIHPEDTTTLRPSTDFIGDGAGLQLIINRAVQVNFDLYSKKMQVRTQARTVGDMLKEKGIALGPNDRVSVIETTPIVADMDIRVWREGKQTVTIDEPVGFESQKIFDADRTVDYRSIQTVGVSGVRAVTYEIEVKDGKELSRVKIASIVTRQPTKQMLVLGIKNLPHSLTQGKGAHIFTDSRGVAHRETYYDLNMSRVMQSCGQGGRYEVRPGGVKVDADGYVIIAANFGRYPRCSIVETSVGPGKVYDTGGFAAVHPEGFDIATDWSRADGI